MRIYIFTFLFLQLISHPSFGQNEPLVTVKDSAMEREVRTNYISHGITVDMIYETLNVDNTIKMKDQKTGEIFRSEAQDDKPTDLNGFKIGYARIPKNGFGWSTGLDILKVNYKAGDQNANFNYRAEGNASFSTLVSNNTAVFGFGGINVNYIPNQSILDPFGMGLQAGLGFGIGSNIMLSLSYFITMHDRKDLQNDPGLAMFGHFDTAYFVRGTSARLSYSF